MALTRAFTVSSIPAVLSTCWLLLEYLLRRGCGDVLQAVHHMPYPDTLGKMELRVGLHVGPVYAGVLGVKFPRWVGDTPFLTFYALASGGCAVTADTSA